LAVCKFAPYFWGKQKRLGKDKLIQELFQKIEVLTSRLEQAENEIAALKLENATLKSRLNSNSNNSSKPPSSDGYLKKPAFSKTGKGKQGGQSGHQGRTLNQVINPDKTVTCKPVSCNCGHTFTKEETALAEKRQVFDLPEPRLEVTEYRIYKVVCPDCGLVHRGAAPEGVNAPVQYGNRTKAYVTLLNVHFKIPFKKIQLLFGDLFGCPINESSVYSASMQCYDKLWESERIIRSKVTEQDVVHADETGVRVEGKLHWLHVATSQLYTYLFVHANRGTKALESEKSLLGDFKGWLVHDCWGSYFKLHGLGHSICGAHILRELEGLIENDKSRWAKLFKTFLMDVYKMPFEERLKRQHHIMERYKLICAMGEKSEPPPIKTPGKRGRYKCTKGRNLVERLISQQNAVLAFAFNKNVPFTNNLAERDIRPVKVKQKISNCFRTENGADIYARIEGFVSTARKNNRNVFSELSATFEGRNFIIG
jgi:transposase